jgi:hypothetical protein
MTRYLSSSTSTALTMLTRDEKKMDPPATVYDEVGFDIVDRKLSFENVQDASQGRNRNVMHRPPAATTNVRRSLLALPKFAVGDVTWCMDSPSSTSKQSKLSLNPYDVDDSVLDQVNTVGIVPFEDSQDDGAPNLARSRPTIVVGTVRDDDDDVDDDGSTLASDNPYSPVIRLSNTAPPSPVTAGDVTRPFAPAAQVTEHSSSGHRHPRVEAPVDLQDTYPHSSVKISKEDTSLLPKNTRNLTWFRHTLSSPQTWKNMFVALAAIIVVNVFVKRATNRLLQAFNPGSVKSSGLGPMRSDFDGAATFAPPDARLVIGDDELGDDTGSSLFEEAALFEVGLSATGLNATSSISESFQPAGQPHDFMDTELHIDTLEVEFWEDSFGSQVVNETLWSPPFSSIATPDIITPATVGGITEQSDATASATGGSSLKSVVGLGIVMIVITQGISMSTRGKITPCDRASFQGEFLSKLLSVGPKLERTGRRSSLHAELGIDMKNYVCLNSKDLRLILQYVFGRDAPSRYSKNELVGMVVKEYAFYLDNQKKIEICKILQHKGVVVPSSTSKSQMINAALVAGL